MVFSSLNFLFIFLPVVLAVYYLAPRILRNGILFFFSLIFYAWGEPVYVSLMIFSTIVDYIHGMLVEKHRGTKKAKMALIASVVINLTLLCVFKYADFIVGNINLITGSSIPLPGLPLPIGISFYTFQTMSYTIDVYRGDAKMQKNIISFGAYVALFPQLIAGPIVRFSTVAEQLDHRRESFDQFSDGIRRFITGLAKKVLLANNIGMLWTTLSGLEADRVSVLSAWLAVIAYGFQIYFDFSGYSDMAIGLGRMFGFTFLENFEYPFIAKSITELWRRWHISLGTWFREYVYFPLGGSRRGLAITLRNTVIVWLLTGMWHGASWNFVLWGVYFCVFLIAEKLFLADLLKKLPTVLRHLYMLLVFTFSWNLFAFDSLPKGRQHFLYMLGRGGIPLYNDTALFYLLSNALLLVILALASTPAPRRWGWALLERIRSTAGKTVLGNAVLAFLFLLSVAYLVDSTYNPFLYFRF